MLLLYSSTKSHSENATHTGKETKTTCYFQINNSYVSMCVIFVTFSHLKHHIKIYIYIQIDSQSSLSWMSESPHKHFNIKFFQEPRKGSPVALIQAFEEDIYI